MRISDWSSDVCSSDLCLQAGYIARLSRQATAQCVLSRGAGNLVRARIVRAAFVGRSHRSDRCDAALQAAFRLAPMSGPAASRAGRRSEEHTSELQSLMRISYAVFSMKTQTNTHYKR